MTGSEDQELDLSIWTDIHTHTHTYRYCQFIYMCFAMYLFCIFMKYVLSANPRYSSHMHQLMNFDFLEYD